MYLLQVDGDHLAVLYEPGALFHLHLMAQLALQDGRLALQPHLDAAPLDVHHHVLALHAELDIKRHQQLRRVEHQFELDTSCFCVTYVCLK